MTSTRLPVLIRLVELIHESGQGTLEEQTREAIAIANMIRESGIVPDVHVGTLDGSNLTATAEWFLGQALTDMSSWGHHDDGGLSVAMMAERAHHLSADILAKWAARNAG
jgi:hypothetical protein